MARSATGGCRRRRPWPGWLREIAGNEVRYLDAARMLLRYSMIEAQESVQGSHMMHPVVHKWASHIQDGAAKREVLRLAVMVVGLSVPSSTSKDYWVMQRRLLPHAERCSWWIGEIYRVGRSFDDITAMNAMHMLGDLYSDQGRLTEAESMYQRALEGSEKALGRDHTSTLDTVNNLGNLYKNQGKRAEAAAMKTEVLEKRPTLQAQNLDSSHANHQIGMPSNEQKPRKRQAFMR